MKGKPLTTLTLDDATGCLQCTKPFTEEAPSTYWVPVRNPTRGLRVFVPVHQACEADAMRARGRALFLRRLEHVLDSHPDLVRP